MAVANAAVAARWLYPARSGATQGQQRAVAAAGAGWVGWRLRTEQLRNSSLDHRARRRLGSRLPAFAPTTSAPTLGMICPRRLGRGHGHRPKQRHDPPVSDSLTAACAGSRSALQAWHLDHTITTEPGRCLQSDAHGAIRAVSSHGIRARTE